MRPLEEVTIPALDPERFGRVLSPEVYSEFRSVIAAAKKVFEGRTVWNVNSTGRGGGVAEMLASLLAYARGAEVDARWMVIQGDPEFFAVTKRIHNHLHGASGDDGLLGPDEHEIYERTLAPNAEALAELVKPDDIVLLHDPQTAGLTARMKEVGAIVIWRCHVGLDTPNETARNAWNFLRSYIKSADRYIFSREAFAWDKLKDSKIVLIAPSIDAFSPKNQDMDNATVEAILATTGLLATTTQADPVFVIGDGTNGVVGGSTEMYGAPAPGPSVPLVVQVSRWDRLKDPLGVMEGFVRYVAPSTDAHLVLAGPSVADVADDPEGKEVLEESITAWQGLDAAVRERVHLACLPMDDLLENAAIVNALQRRAAVIVQKSIAEGFGLTVAEGMWKARPVVATRIGGIQDQIENGVTGLLIDDPRDLESYGRAVLSLLQDPEKASSIGDAARREVTERFLGPRHLTQYFDLMAGLMSRSGS
jgi:trehalose synthase